jgi:hypothetical protein
MQPPVSILIPAHDAREWIADTLRSAIAQTWERKEIECRTSTRFQPKLHLPERAWRTASDRLAKGISMAITSSWKKGHDDTFIVSRKVAANSQ